MRIVLTFVLNAGLNLALGLVIAGLLGPAEYGRFAVGSTVGVVLAMSLFDWLRLSATRFYGEASRTADPAIRTTLNASYTGLAGLLVVVASIAAFLHVDFGLGAALLAAAALSGLSNGVFDFYAALARARFLDRTYARLVIIKNILAFALGVGAAVATHDPAWALAASSLGAILAVFPVHGALRDSHPGAKRGSLAHLRSFAAYGFPVVAANIVFQVVILANRASAATTFGFADSGQLSLATDMSLRLFLAVGSAIDVLLFQLAVRAEAEGERGAAEAQLRFNAVAVTAVLTLLAVGYAMTLPAFTELLVPMHYRGDFARLTLLLLPGLLLFSIAQFAINPMFQVARRTGPVLAASGVAILCDALGVAFLPSSAGIGGVALVHGASLAVSSLALTLVALRKPAHRPALADGVRLAAAAVLAALAMWPLRTIGPAWLSLGVGTLVGTLVFCTAAVLFDLAKLRGRLLSRLSGKMSEPLLRPIA